MSEICFICLEYSTSKRCNVCVLSCHPHCWKKFINDNNTKKNYLECESDENSVYVYIHCPQCSSMIKYKSNSISIIIREKIERCSKANGRDNKIKISTELFDYLYKNMWYVYMYENVNITVKNKLISFYLEDKSGYGEYVKNMYEKMFGVPIPSEYIS